MGHLAGIWPHRSVVIYLEGSARRIRYLPRRDSARGREPHPDVTWLLERTGAQVIVHRGPRALLPLPLRVGATG